MYLGNDILKSLFALFFLHFSAKQPPSFVLGFQTIRSSYIQMGTIFKPHLKKLTDIALLCLIHTSEVREQEMESLGAITNWASG